MDRHDESVIVTSKGYHEAVHAMLTRAPTAGGIHFVESSGVYKCPIEAGMGNPVYPSFEVTIDAMKNFVLFLTQEYGLVEYIETDGQISIGVPKVGNISINNSVVRDFPLAAAAYARSTPIAMKIFKGVQVTLRCRVIPRVVWGMYKPVFEEMYVNWYKSMTTNNTKCTFASTKKLDKAVKKYLEKSD